MKLIQNIALISALMVVGCKPVDKPDPDPNPGGGTESEFETKNTVIAYMVADNNLSEDAEMNINAMEYSFSPQLDCRMLVFYNQAGGDCELLDIVSDQRTKEIHSKVLKEYPKGTDPCKIETFKQVMADCMELTDSETYALNFWSHGSGWIPNGMTPAKAPALAPCAPDYAFGASDHFDTVFELNELCAALPEDIMFEYVHFDACNMASIESIYELRGKAKYVVASSAEILASGFPYRNAMDEVLTCDVVGMAKAYYDYYSSRSGVNQSGTISVTDVSKLDKLAAELKEVAKGGEQPTAVQQFGRRFNSSADFSNLYWDFGDMVQRTYGDKGKAVMDALEDAVIYKAATPMLFEGDYYGQIKVETFSGITIYIPKLSQPKTLEIYTNDYQWAKDTEFFKWAY